MNLIDVHVCFHILFHFCLLSLYWYVHILLQKTMNVCIGVHTC